MDAELDRSEPMSAETLRTGLATGDRELLRWLHRRARRQAASRFSGWAWQWIEDDFLSELTLQLSITVVRPDFALRGSVEAYVDACIANLCKTFFHRIGRIRRSDPLEEHAGELIDATWSLQRVAAALELRRALMSVEPACRKLLVDKYVLGLSLQEIGERTATQPKTVQSRLHECRERVRRWLRLRQKH